MDIKSARFIVSSSKLSQCPETTLPEYAFIGRSNVGKSSLINMLTGINGLAKTSGRPGKTQLINHFLVNESWYIVDLPGYGYARSSRTAREAWGKMTRDYLLHREQLANIFVLVDSRLEPQHIDLDFIDFLGTNGLPLSVVFTKTDKETQRTVARNVDAFRTAMSQRWDELPPMFLTSSQKRHGRSQLLDYVEQINSQIVPLTK